MGTWEINGFGGTICPSYQTCSGGERYEGCEACKGVEGRARGEGGGVDYDEEF